MKTAMIATIDVLWKQKHLMWFNLILNLMASDIRDISSPFSYIALANIHKMAE